MLVMDPKHLLGKALKIYLKDGGAFYFYCNEAGKDWIAGHDDEKVNLRIDISDIDYIKQQ